MIINIRGTSGSGKSWVVRRVMEDYGFWNGFYVPGRKQPLYHYPEDGRSIAVLGHYNSPCGGCDTIGSAKQVYTLIQKLSQAKVIIAEGLLLSEDVKWSSYLKDLRVIFLTTSIEQCITQIEARRKEAGNDKPLNRYNTENRVGVIERARVKLLTAGVDCRRLSAEQAPEMILSWLKSGGDVVA